MAVDVTKLSKDKEVPMRRSALQCRTLPVTLIKLLTCQIIVWILN